MASIKIVNFKGEAPRVSSELLAETAAQTAYNVKLYSGDLIPYRVPKTVDNLARQGSIKTIYPLKNPDTNANVWLSWTTDVDIVTPTDASDDEQRFYYTGDVEPRVSTYDLATTGSAPYPASTGYYDLGLDAPTTTVTAAAASFSVVSSTHYERDSGNTATFYGNGNHNLRSGNVVTVRDFSGSTEAESFNASNVQVTVINATDFQYFSSGDTVSKTANTTGRADMAGNTQIRTYIYTHITPWGEESVPSSVSNEVFLKEGQTVTVSNIPTAKPSGDNFVRGVRLYRSVTSASASDFFLLDTLWFPTTTATLSRVGSTNIATVKLANPHNMVAGNRFKISGTTTDSGNFNVTNGIVLSVVDRLTFTYSNNGGDVSSTADANGTLFHDVAETVDDTARYWGDGGAFNFTDDFLVSNLNTILESTDYDKPKSTMQGLTAINNNMLAGFFDNQLCFSFPDKPHAWPIKFRITVDDPVVGIESTGAFTLVLTEKYPYVVTGNNPETLDIKKINVEYPCVAKRSIVNMGYGIAWATNGGLALYDNSGLTSLVTRGIHDWDTWSESIDPTTIIGQYYNDKYFGSHSTNTFIFEKEQNSGYFTTSQYTFTAAYLDSLNDILYYIDNELGDVKEWDNSGQVLSPLNWKSKTIVTKDYINFGAARVIADYTDIDQEILNQQAFNATVPTTNATLWTQSQQLGCINGPTDYMLSGNRDINIGTLNAFPINGDDQMLSLLVIVGALPVTFKLFVEKDLVFQATIQSDDIFRLPSGYRSDTFEVEVSGSARIRAIHIGETPNGLRTA